ncbi:Retrovirus-related Pol polyprotein from transposon TNT 1-94 [Gossypium australe]|uniref:Retrovirus-related Pol polyprotein from transposon TNT 1-94 n=1 Tax=Gossypium australe TaxID=47621 RepID=A0A5B6V9L0_9ROSI|nr:Retrovirus-related Pol polyprotein from transposon TNT 1-94 [Gossypium australe]
MESCQVTFIVDGSVERFKARLVEKRFTHSYENDCQKTFAPVANFNTIRVLLSLIVNQDWLLYQLNIKNAFLDGDLEEVYMTIPLSLENKSNNNLVCKMKKSLYDLKQSPHAWFERFTKTMIANGYQQCQTGHTLFVKSRIGGKKVILIVYMDYIILTRDDFEEIMNLKKLLAIEFEIKDLGTLRYFLGMEVGRSKEGIVISQRKYILDLEGSYLVDKGRYQRLVGKLIYPSQTRLDIIYSVTVVSQHMNNQTEYYLEVVNIILRYLKMTPGHGLLFRKCANCEVEIYTGAT